MTLETRTLKLPSEGGATKAPDRESICAKLDETENKRVSSGNTPGEAAKENDSPGASNPPFGERTNSDGNATEAQGDKLSPEQEQKRAESTDALSIFCQF